MKILNCNFKTICNEEIQIHDFTEGDKTTDDYKVRAEMQIDDDGHIIYLEGFFDIIRYDIFFFATTESLFELEERYPEFCKEYVQKHNRIVTEGINSIFPNVDISERYKEQCDILVDLMQQHINNDNKNYDLKLFEKIFDYFLFDETMCEDQGPEEETLNFFSDLAKTIMESPNYSFVEKVDNMISRKSTPFYHGFGRQDHAMNNLAFISEAEDSFIKRVLVKFFLNSEKLLKGTIISVPDCNNEMDSLFYAIVFEGRDTVRYNCELMEPRKFCLRKNNDYVCQLFLTEPTIDDIWDVIQREAPDPQSNELMALLSNLPKKKEWFFMLYDDKDELLLERWLGTADVKKEFFSREGIDYVAVSGPNPARYILRYNSSEDKLEGVQYSDIEMVKKLDF